MKTLLVATTIALLVLCGYVSAAQTAQPSASPIPAELLWAWGYGASSPSAEAAKVDDNELVRIPGSTQALKQALFRRTTGDEGVKEVPDWAPEAHPPIPDIVRFGRSIRDSSGRYLSPTDRNGNVVFAAGRVEDGGIRACGFCHSAHGLGHPGNAPVAGLPVGYLMQQMEDFKNGLRLSSDPKKGNVVRMAWYAAQMTPAETKAAVEYFAALPFPRNIKVVESATAPKTRLNEYFEPVPGPAGGTEPLAGRIIEVPENPELTGLRAPNTGFIAYVPIGSVAKGERLADTLQCRLCHGPELGGLNMGAAGGEVPPIAGRSPSYTVRQLVDMKTGARRGPKSALMKAVVSKMTSEDMLNVAAHVASLAPPARPAALPASR